MTDTPEHIKALQLEIWLSKPPMERLRQFLVDNDAFYSFTENIKKQLSETSPVTGSRDAVTDEPG